MADLGAVCFDQPMTAQHFIIDGVLFRVGFAFDKTPRQAGAQILGMADGSSVIQVPTLDDPSRAVNPVYWDWEFEYQLDYQDEYQVLERARAFGKAVYLVDHVWETEAFIAASTGQTLFILKRTPAAEAEPLFDSVTFEDKYYLNGVEQTVVGSSPPGAGEVFVSGVTVETPALTEGDEFVAQYYPAYKVAFTNSPFSLNEYNDVRKAIVATEVIHQSV
jgi:hypothetical protein